MSCRSSWFLSDDDSADASPASAPVAAVFQDYAIRLPRAMMQRDYRGFLDRATAADLARTRDSSAALSVAMDPSADCGVDRANGSLILPFLFLAAMFALS